MSDEKFKRCIKKNIVKIKNSDGTEEIFALKPIDFLYYKDLYNMSQDMDKGKKADGSAMFKGDNLKKVKDMLTSVVHDSYPDITDTVLEDFINTNWKQLLDQLNQMIAI